MNGFFELYLSLTTISTKVCIQATHNCGKSYQINPLTSDSSQINSVFSFIFILECKFFFQTLNLRIISHQKQNLKQNVVGRPVCKKAIFDLTVEIS